jgi:predicted house-cleaning noncanonical NTP pyrophosphatase (MazG superfamily)
MKPPKLDRNMKLIRDKIHERIEDKSRVFQLERMNDPSLVICLKDKLEEETREVQDASDEELLEELADVYEVITAMCVLSGHSIEDLLECAEDKRRERGSFYDRWFLRTEA